MSKPIDLNELRRLVLTNQTTASGAMIKAAAPSETILVSREGKLQLASNLTPESTRTLATVEQDTFHGRNEEELATARKFMPTTTRKHRTEDGVDGWLYSFYCEFGQQYVMFAYFDGVSYQVIVLQPTVERRFCSPHTGHVFSDGRICFGQAYGGGRKNLQDAYAKSVLWANGMSSMLLSRNEVFPFSINNQ
jgi:hypothetical protein